MPDHVYKSVEITGSSTTDVTDAINKAIAKASETLRHVEWFDVVSMRGNVADGAIAHFQVTLKVGLPPRVATTLGAESSCRAVRSGRSRAHWPAGI